MKVDRIDFVGRSARRQLRKAIDGFERTVDVPRLLSVLAHDGLPQDVRAGAAIELRRRYSLAVKNIGLLPEFDVEEQLTRNPLEHMSQGAAKMFEERHMSRCELWVRLEVTRRLVSEQVAAKCVPWLALSLHHGFTTMRLRSLEELGGICQTKPAMFKEAMYGVDGKSFTVWVGANWEPGENRVHVPSDHWIYEKSYKSLVRPSEVSCWNCSKKDGQNSLQRCAGVGDVGPLFFSELGKIVNRDGCPFFSSESSDVVPVE